MTKKELLLASFSAIAALTLTACGDDTTTTTKPADTTQGSDNPAQVQTAEDPGQASTLLSSPVDATSKAVAALAAQASTPQSFKDYQSAYNSMEAAKQILETASQNVSKQSKEGSYVQQMKALDEQEAAFKAILEGDLIAKVKTQKDKFEGSADRSAVAAGLKANELDGMARFISETEKEINGLKNGGFFTKDLLTIVKNRRAELDANLAVLGQDTLAVANKFDITFPSVLRARINDRITKRDVPLLGGAKTGTRLYFEDSAGSTGEVSATAAMRALFKSEPMKALVKEAKLEEVVQKVYGEVVSPRLAIFAYPNGSATTISKSLYTLKELQDSLGKGYTSGQAGIATLNGKTFPWFKDTGVTNIADGKEPTVQEIKDLQTWADANLPADVKEVLLANSSSNVFFKPQLAAREATLTAKLSAGLVDTLTKTSLRDARRGAFGIDAANFALNGTAGEKVSLSAPIYVKLDGSVESGKALNATGTVATKVANTVVAVAHAAANTGVGFTADSSQAETSVTVSQNFGAAFAEVQFGSVAAKAVNKADFNGSSVQLTLGYDAAYVTPFVQLKTRDVTRSDLLDANVAHTSVALGAEVALSNYAADSYVVSTNLVAKAGFDRKSWTSLDRHLGTDVGFAGSLDFTGSLKLNSGVSFASNLGLGSVAGASAGLNVSLAR